MKFEFCFFDFQARTLAPQLAENSEIRFFVATQTLKPQNQIHLVELNENASTLKQRVRPCQILHYVKIIITGYFNNQIIFVIFFRYLPIQRVKFGKSTVVRIIHRSL